MEAERQPLHKQTHYGSVLFACCSESCYTLPFCMQRRFKNEGKSYLVQWASLATLYLTLCSHCLRCPSIWARAHVCSIHEVPLQGAEICSNCGASPALIGEMHPLSASSRKKKQTYQLYPSAHPLPQEVSATESFRLEKATKTTVAQPPTYQHRGHKTYHHDFSWTESICA